jgi:hypothetical protein
MRVGNGRRGWIHRDSEVVVIGEISKAKGDECWGCSINTGQERLGASVDDMIHERNVPATASSSFHHNLGHFPVYTLTGANTFNASFSSSFLILPIPIYQKKKDSNPGTAYTSSSSF